MEGISPALSRQEFSLDFSSTRFLVIGGNGYFGYKLVEALVGKGARKVRVFDRVQTRFNGCQEVDFIIGDICDAHAVEAAMKEVDVVFHTASCFGFPAFGAFGEGKLEWQVNVEGTRNIIKAARNQALLRNQPSKQVKLIYIGSSSAVFNGDRDFVQEPEDIGYPAYHVDHYGRCKAIAEQEVMASNSPDDGLVTCVLRPNGIYGENEMIHIPRVRKLCATFFNIIPIDFDSQCDWTFVDNLSFACLLAAERMGPKNSPVNGNCYNITDGETISMMGFFGKSIRETGGMVEPIFFMPAFLFIFVCYLMELICYTIRPVINIHAPFTHIEAIKSAKSHSFSIAKAKAHLSYVPIVSLQEGIDRAAADFKKRYYAEKKPKLQ